jgi:hypothetical protein
MDFHLSSATGLLAPLVGQLASLVLEEAVLAEAAAWPAACDPDQGQFAE